MTIFVSLFCSYFLIYCCITNNKNIFSSCSVLPLLCFVTTLPRKENLSNHALLCDFPSSVNMLSVLTVCNLYTNTLLSKYICKRRISIFNWEMINDIWWFVYYIITSRHNGFVKATLIEERMPIRRDVCRSC